jgi:hypothetical protein
MSQAPADAEELDEDHGSPIPDPPRRVPFGVAVTTALLGMLAVPLVLLAMVTLFSGSGYTDDVGEATLRGLAASVVAVCAVLVVAVAWSFVRDGTTVGPMIVGLLVVIAGLIMLGVGVAGESPDTEGLRVGVLAIVLGLGVLLVPLLGQAPAYLAARRVWSRAERDWLRELTTPEVPPLGPQQWPGHYAPQQQWGGAPQPGYPPQYQYPPQPGPGWTGQQPPQYQAWPEPTVPPLAQPAQQFSAPPAQQYSGPPAQQSTQQSPFPAAQPHPGQQVQQFSGPPAQQYSAAPAQPLPGAPAQAESAAVPTESRPAASTDDAQAERPAAEAESHPAPVPLAAAQQAPTEQIRPAGPPA